MTIKSLKALFCMCLRVYPATENCTRRILCFCLEQRHLTEFRHNRSSNVHQESLAYYATVETLLIVAPLPLKLIYLSMLFFRSADPLQNKNNMDKYANSANHGARDM